MLDDQARLFDVPQSPLHPFTLAGLGPAPFAQAGYFDARRRSDVCDCCGAKIRHVFKVKAADGRVSKVGSDCILKLSDDMLKTWAQEQRERERRLRPRRR